MNISTGNSGDLVDGIQVEKVTAASQSKSEQVKTMYGPTLATLGAHSPRQELCRLRQKQWRGWQKCKQPGAGEKDSASESLYGMDLP